MMVPSKTIGLTLILAFLLVALPASVRAQEIRQIPLPPSQNPSNADIPVAGAVWAGNTLYVSGWLDPDMADHPDTETQTAGILSDIESFLGSQGLTMGNVVMMHVYLGHNPATDGKPDYRGMMAGYSRFFGTEKQPATPARTTLQVILPAASRGALVEIDLIAVRTE